MAISSAPTSQKRSLVLGFLVLFLVHWLTSAGLKSPPKGVDALEDLDISRMFGHWYELARMPSAIEDEFGQASLVIKKEDEEALSLSLFDRKNPKKSWADTADYQLEAPSSVLISCFLWLKCGYHVVLLDSNQYSWFVVAGHNLDQVWLFSREPGIDSALLQRIIQDIHELGFDQDRLEIHNAPRQVVVAPNLDQPIKPKNPTDDPYAILPETPANLPPIPSQMPETPMNLPAMPKNVPQIPRNMPTPNWNPMPMP
jgi:apolipoprotein D and lipocalin family protein